MAEKLTIDPATTPVASVYKLLIGCVVPRPIAFVSTVSPRGIFNLAPFSFFNVVCADPPVLGFSCSRRTPMKDTLANVRDTGEFVVNIVSEEIAEQMNVCSGSYPGEVDEFQVSGLTPIASDLVRAPRVLESHVNMECKLLQIVEVSARPNGGSLVLGEVVRLHIDSSLVQDFRVDPDKLRAIGRMAGNDYARTRDRFTLVGP